MKKLYFALILINGLTFGQVQLKILNSFGSALYDINVNGKGVHGNGYYDFETNSSSATEEGVGQTVTSTNTGDVLGMKDDGTGTYVPALKHSGTWNLLPGIPANVTLYDVSENGKYVVGQTTWTPENGAWGFIYNVEASTYKLLSSPLYEYGACYAVNNEGIAVGWVDDLPSGTLRMPAYFKEDGSITLIESSAGEAASINSSNEIVGNLGGIPFYYKIGNSAPQTFAIPEDQLTGAFSAISDTGVIVGYVQTYIPLDGWYRVPLIYHASYGTAVKLLADVLTEASVDATELSGTAYKISTDGKYIGGFTSGAAFFAKGWAVDLDDLFTMKTQETALNKVSVYPNPAKDVVNINAKNMTAIEIYNLVGQKVLAPKTGSQINISNLAKGVYMVKVMTGDKPQTVKLIKE